MLANERTLLSYARTAIGLVAAGVSSLHFLDGDAFDLAGWALVAGGLAVQGIGTVRYWRMRRVLRAAVGEDAGPR